MVLYMWHLPTVGEHFAFPIPPPDRFDPDAAPFTGFKSHVKLMHPHHGPRGGAA
jgi:hypothetical protein